MNKVVNKKYLSEVILIICTNDLYNFRYWLEWHLNIIKFDHAIIIDNDSPVDIYSECLKYNNVEYIKKIGTVSQSDLYTYYVNNSKSYWCLCIDDDEFLYISDKYQNSINNLLKSFSNEYPDFLKISFPWIMMVSDNLMENRDFRTPVFDLFTRSLTQKLIQNPDHFDNIESFLNVKTIVNTLAKHYYAKDTEKIRQIDLETINMSPLNLYFLFYPYIYSDNYLFFYDKLGTVHNPISKLFDTYIHAINAADKKINIGYFGTSDIDVNWDAFIGHYKYRTLEEWRYKIYDRNKFNDLYQSYDIFYNERKIHDIYNLNKIYNDKLKLLWYKYKTI